MANLDIWVNCSASDTALNTSGGNWIQFASGNDQLIFTAGSDQVTDGADTPTQQQLINAGIVLTGLEIIVDDYLMLDASANLLRSIDLMGNTTNRYVLAFDFDDATASEPVLEVWDDINFDSIDSTILGAGTASQSFIRGITTTNGAPSADWTGNRLAGAGSGNFLYLNDQNGALVSADTLYANLKVIIPASQTVGFSANPVFVCKYLSN